MEIHLHPTGEDGTMAISPNNCAFLLNLTLPVVNFWLIMLHHTEQGIPKLTAINITFLNEVTLAESALICALDSEMLLHSITQDEERALDLEVVYLRRLKRATENGILRRINDHNFLGSIFHEDNVRQLYHRRIWLILGCPRIDDIGGKVHGELGLDLRLKDFKRNLLCSTLIDSVFKTH